MNNKRCLAIVFGMVCISFLTTITVDYASAGEKFYISIMKAKEGEAKKYAPLKEYMAQKGINLYLVNTNNYFHAAKMFSRGEIDGMFSGSGVAGTMILKGVAEPVVRPVSKKGGWSEYWAVIITKQGEAKFTDSAKYFDGKTVVGCRLASSGEFYFRSQEQEERSFLDKLLSKKPTFKYASSHGKALEILNDGGADIAIIKNRVWDGSEDKYAGLEQVGRDSGKNPNGTLIVSKKANPSVVNKVKAALLAIKDDTSPEALAVKESLGASEYITTTSSDFDHTLALLRSAGVDKSFSWSFE